MMSQTLLQFQHCYIFFFAIIVDMSLDEQDKEWITTQLAIQLEATETRLLRGFEGWVARITQESQSHSRRQREYEERLDLLDTRLNDLERWQRQTRGEKP
jgi:hypothetical protein